MGRSEANQLISITAARQKHPLTHLFTLRVYTLVLNKAASSLCVVTGHVACFGKRAEVSALDRGHQRETQSKATGCCVVPPRWVKPKIYPLFEHGFLLVLVSGCELPWNYSVPRILHTEQSQFIFSLALCLFPARMTWKGRVDVLLSQSVVLFCLFFSWLSLKTLNASQMMFPGVNSVNRLGDMLTSPCVNVCVNEFTASGYWCLSRMLLSNRPYQWCDDPAELSLQT